MRKKALLAKMVCLTGFQALAERISTSNVLRILCYHRVMDFQESTYAFDEEIVSASPSDFEAQMLFVSRNYRVLTFAELDGLLQKGLGIPDKSVVITFDDGYADNYHFAFPILKKHGLRAVFFITTGYIDGKDLFWFEKLAYLGKKGMLGSREIPKERFSPADHSSSWTAYRLHLMKMAGRERKTELAVLEQKTPLNIPPEERARVLPLTWQEVREMCDAGMEIGSHTRTHAVLGSASDEEMGDELRESRDAIEKEVGQKVQSIAYPVGTGQFAVNERVFLAAERAGYRWGVTNVSGIEKSPTKNRFSLKRLRVERYMGLDWFKSQLLFPEIFA